MMLTANLLRVRIRKKNVEPIFISPQSPRYLEIAEELLSLFDLAKKMDWTRAEIQDNVRKITSLAVDHKLIGGLAKVILDRCEFDTEPLPLPNAPDAFEVREMVFSLAALKGPLSRHKGVLGRPVARSIFEEIANRLGCQADDVERTLYGDLKDMQKLTSWKGFATPESLLHRYNISLCQSILLRASCVRIQLGKTSPKWARLLFKYIKFHRLIYKITEQDSGFQITLDGPQSLFQQSTRYGMQLALFFPALLLLPGVWSLEADLLWGKKRKFKKIFRIDHQQGLQSHYTPTGVWRSKTELWFEERFAQKEREWTLLPGEILRQSGQRVIIPDFKLQRADKVVFLEIVGFWRKGQLQKLLKDCPPNLIIAASKSLAGGLKEDSILLNHQILFFREVISVPKVLECAAAIYEKK